MAVEGAPALDGALFELDFGADDFVLAAFLALEDGQSEAVVALLRNHPVVHVLEPVELAGEAELRDPARLAGDIHDLKTKLIHGDEPLVDEAKDELGAAAP